MVAAREGWGEKIKALRVAAGIAQEALTKKIAPGFFNIMSGAETEVRKFTPEERTKFFLAIKQPMDNAIPVCSVEEAARRKEFKKRNYKARKNKLPKDTPAKAALKKSAKETAPAKRKYVRKSDTPVLLDSRTKKPVSQKEIRKRLAADDRVPARHAVSRLEPVIASLDSISPIKRAVLEDINTTVMRPHITDDQVLLISNLFKALFTSVVLR